MKYKSIPIILSACFVCAQFSAYAVNITDATAGIIAGTGMIAIQNVLNEIQSSKPDEQGVRTVGFTGLESTIRENNQTVKGFEKTLASIGSQDVSAQFFAQRQGYQQQLAMYKSQETNYKTALSSLNAALGSASDDATKAALDAQIDTMEALIKQTTISITSTNAMLENVDEMEEEAQQQIDDLYATTKKQLENATNAIIFGAQSQYIAMMNLQVNIDALERTLASIDRSIPVMEKQYEIGMISELELKTIKGQREDTQIGLDAMKSQMTTLQTSLSLMLGYPASERAAVSTLPWLSPYTLSQINYADDLALALENSYLIWEKQDAVRSASNDYEDDVTSTLHAYEAAKLNLEATKEQVNSSFRTLYNTIFDKKTVLTQAEANLSLAQDTFKASEVQYEIGMISEIEYLSAKDQYLSAEDAVKTAETDLYSAYNQYVWACNGYMTA